MLEFEKQLKQVISIHREKLLSIEISVTVNHTHWNVVLNDPQRRFQRFSSSIEMLEFLNNYQNNGKIAPMTTNKPSIPERTATPNWRKRTKKLLKKTNRYFMCIFGSLFIGYISVAFCLQKPDTTTWTVDQRTGYLILCTVLFIVIGKYSRTLKLNMN